MRPVPVFSVHARIIQFFCLALLLILVSAGSVLAQSHPASPLKANRLPASLARIEVERDSLMRVPLRYRTPSRDRHNIRSRTLTRRSLTERLVTRSKTDYVQRPPRQSVMTVASNEADSLALVALYQSTGGSSWTDNTGWLSGPVSTWFGVALNFEGRVIGVDLENNGLFGSLPEEITGLTELIQLDLSDNLVLVRFLRI